MLVGGAARELLTETFPMTRVAAIVAVTLLVAVTATLWLRTGRLERELAGETERVRDLSRLLGFGEAGSFSPEDFAEARRELEGRVSDALARVEALESRAGARASVIAAASRSVVFLQGSYGFVDEQAGLPLRFALPGAGPAPAEPGPPVTTEGNGPVVEVLFTGTAFIADGQGNLLTNRHVARPWDFDETAALVVARGYRPVMRRFLGFLPGAAEPFDVEPLATSETADLALLRGRLPVPGGPALALAERAPDIGTEVIVLGYPTGMRALLARADAAFLRALEEEEASLDFWALARRLAAGGHVAPLATVGVVGQTTPGSVVYDAQTTHGGSGGPVLDLDGNVVAVNSAIIPEFGGSNMGVPAARARELLRAYAAGAVPD